MGWGLSRAFALLAAEGDGADQGEGEGVVEAKNPPRKTETPPRRVCWQNQTNRISDWVAAELRKYVKDVPRLAGMTGRVFVNKAGRPLNRSALGRRMRKIAEIGQLPDGFHAHRLRHTFASVLYYFNKNIIEVQNALGHKHLNTTQIYTHPVYSPEKQDIEVFAPLFRESEKAFNVTDYSG